ncbi:MAG: peptidylprolyl isomerase [Pyrinomonadaceae bacterium]
MSNLIKGSILLVAVLAIGVGLVVWKKKVGGHETASFKSISKDEMQLLVSDLAEKNPMAIKRLAEDAELRKKQAESLKQLLAFAVAAQKEGIAADETNRQELENIRAQTVAVSYDNFINKDKGPMPQFGFITEDQLKEYWGETEGQAAAAEPTFWDKLGLSGTAETRRREAEFQKFVDTKVKLMKEANPQMKDREISDDEIKQAREFFAKMKIYEAEFDQKANSLDPNFVKKVNLQTKLQQAQFLARLYSEKIADKVKATDEEISKYIAEHPEIDPASKKAKAVEILNRAKSGEDFAKLANEFSEDPGNKDPKGESQGGLYKDVTQGRMVKPFEDAALSLQPGQIFPDVVETDYGFHIIKLENRSDVNDKSGSPVKYDVRHILISTGVKDPDNPIGRDQPVKQYVRSKIEEEKEKELVDKIVEESGVTVAEDYELPQISEEQIQEMMKKQQSQFLDQSGAGEPDGEAAPEAGSKDAKPQAKKPEAKKK